MTIPIIESKQYISLTPKTQIQNVSIKQKCANRTKHTQALIALNLNSSNDDIQQLIGQIV